MTSAVVINRVALLRREDRDSFLDWLQEEINVAQNVHEEEHHDYECPSWQCSDSDEHYRLFNTYPTMLDVVIAGVKGIIR